MEPEEQWRLERVDELKSLADQRCPLLVYNAETLNEVFFDLFSIDTVDKLFYRISANPHPKILQKAFEMGLAFRCLSLREFSSLMTRFPRMDPDRVLLGPLHSLGPGESIGAFKPGATPLVPADPYTLKGRAGLFKNREIMLSFSLGKEKNPQDEVKEEELKEISTLLKNAGCFLMGIHLEAVEALSLREDPKGLRWRLESLGGFFSGVSLWSLGNGAGTAAGPAHSSLDIPATGGNLESIRENHPDTSLWLEPGPLAIAGAGILLTKAIQTRREGTYTLITLDADMGALGLRGLSHQAHNFSRPHEEATVPSRIVWAGHGPDRGPWEMGPLPPVEKGDILLFTNAGAREPHAGGPASPRRVPEHYLPARSMCPVKL